MGVVASMKTTLVPGVAWPGYTPPPPAQPKTKYQPRTTRRKYESCEHSVRSYLREHPGSTAAEISRGADVRYRLLSDHLRLMTPHGSYVKKGKEYYLP